MNSYELSRNWFNFCFDNPELIRPIHTAIFFFAIEHCNRLGWKQKFGFPSQMVMEAIGVKNWKTYSKALNEIVNFGFIKMIEKSKNQYSSNIIAIVKNTKATTKALDKALSKHSTKHSTKHSQSTVSINKQRTKNKEQIYREFDHLKITDKENQKLIDLGYKQNVINDIYDSIENYSKNKNYKSLYLTARKWLKKDQNKETNFAF
jgi:hypothetical protein